MVYFFILLGFFLPPGCSRSIKNESKKELRLYLQVSPSSLDPRIGGSRLAVTVTRPLFEGLFRMDLDGGYKRALAKSVEMSEDGCVYTFEIHPSKWSNGEEVTAYDFEYAWKCVLDPSFPSRFAYMLYDIKNAFKANQEKCSIDDIGVKAIDSYTLQVTLEHPSPFFPELLAYPVFSPICRSCCQKGDIAPEYVSNGPFVLKKYNLKSEIIFERNPLYWGTSSPHVDKISFAIIEDTQTAYNMFCTGDLDWFGDPCGTVPLDMLSSLTFDQRDVGQTTWLRCQTKAPLLGSKYIRKAIASAIDREVICNKLLNCSDVPAQTILARSLSQLSAPPFKNGDAQEARHLFEKGLEEIKITKESYPALTILYLSADQTSKAIAEIIREQIEDALGIKVIPEGCEPTTFSSRFLSKDFHLCLVDWVTLYQDAGATLHWVGQENLCDDLYKELLDKADNSIDVLDRQTYLKEAEKKVMDYLPIIPIVHQSCKYTKPDYLKGEAWSASGQVDVSWIEKGDLNL